MFFELTFILQKIKVKISIKNEQANITVQIICKMQKFKGRIKFTHLI